MISFEFNEEDYISFREKIVGRKEKILTIFRWVIGFLGVAIGSIPFLAMLISEEKIIRSDSYINSSLIILALGIFLITLNFFKKNGKINMLEKRFIMENLGINKIWQEDNFIIEESPSGKLKKFRLKKKAYTIYKNLILIPVLYEDGNFLLRNQYIVINSEKIKSGDVKEFLKDYKKY